MERRAPIPTGWTEAPLGQVADVVFSNVDKKSWPSEQSVRLCNYLDVYQNDYLGNDHVYMEATASHAEIRKFRLQPGDVIITKDSETPDDIGIPAVVDCVNGTLVCGYHLALIRPGSTVNPVFLAKQIGHERIRRYFGKEANGITRYGLSTGSVTRLPLWAPPRNEQDRVARVLRTLDEAICQTEQVIEKLQEVKQGLLYDLLARGIDDNGKLRPPPEEAPRLYKDSPLGRIPRGWETRLLRDVLTVQLGFAFRSEDYVEDGLLNFRVSNIDRPAYDLGELKYLPKSFWRKFKGQQLWGGEIVIVMVGATTGKLGRVPPEICPALQNQNMWNLVPMSCTHREFLWLILPDAVRRHMSLSQGSARDFLTQKDFLRTLTVLPPAHEQLLIQERASALERRLSAEQEGRGNLHKLKTGLMDDLLTGRVRVAMTEEAA